MQWAFAIALVVVLKITPSYAAESNPSQRFDAPAPGGRILPDPALPSTDNLIPGPRAENTRPLPGGPVTKNPIPHSTTSSDIVAKGENQSGLPTSGQLQCQPGMGVMGLRNIARERPDKDTLEKCRIYLERDVFMLCASFLMLIYSFSLNSIASSFSEDIPETRSDVYNHIKGLSTFPFVFSLFIYVCLSFVINDFIMDVANKSNYSGPAGFFIFIPFNSYLNLFMLSSAILISVSAAWKLNIAIPKDVSDGNASIKLFAIISPLLSIAASSLTIYKGVSLE